MSRYTFVDLFAGCGGLSEGFYQKGFEALAHVEIDKYACQTLKERMRYYGYSDIDKKVINADITTETTLNEIIKIASEKDVDVLIGGPPCQAYSTLGRAKDENGMTNDPRNFLFESYVHILNKLLPKIFVFENVLGLLTAKVKDEKILSLILKELGKNYFLKKDIKECILNSVNYGVPQIRKRIVLIGIRKDINFSIDELYNLIEPTHNDLEDRFPNLPKYRTVADAISDLPYIRPGEGEKITNVNINKQQNDYLKTIGNDTGIIYDHVARKHNIVDMERYEQMAKNKWTFVELMKNRKDLAHDKKRVFSNSYTVQFYDQPSRTIIAHLQKDGNQFIHPDYKQKRTITVREAARLQSFPDDFKFSGPMTQQFKQIGNAVPPLMSVAIAKAISTMLERI
jgi:DNA (cytosine-5-)-methyltransferase